MGSDLKDAVGRRVDDGLSSLEVFGPEAFNDFCTRCDFIADVAISRLFRKGVEEILWEGLFKGREGIFLCLFVFRTNITLFFPLQPRLF